MRRDIRAKDIETPLRLAVVAEHDDAYLQSEREFEKGRSCIIAAVALSAVGWLIVLLIIWALVQLGR
jgi:hypothetical protein